MTLTPAQAPFSWCGAEQEVLGQDLRIGTNEG